MSVSKDFVVKNGLEVSRTLIRTNITNNRVGINTDILNATLDVNGTIVAKGLSVPTGVTTFSNVNITSNLFTSGVPGSSGQYLRATGTGVTWANFPSTRTTSTVTAINGQTLFSFNYTIGLIDVFVNGTKLAPSDFNASTGTNVILAQPCIGGETVELIGYSATTIGITTTIGIGGITIKEEGSTVGYPAAITEINFVGAAVTAVGSGLGVTVYISDTSSINYWESTSVGLNTVSSVGIGTTNPSVKLEVQGDVLINGIVTAASYKGSHFFGDSSSVLGIATAASFSGSGANLTGIVTSIVAGAGLTISQLVGQVTISKTGEDSYWTSGPTGIHTLSNVGVGTTNPRFTLEVGAVGASGTSLYVNGDARITGILTVGTSSIVLDGSNNTVRVGSGVTIDGVSGIISATSVVVNGTTITGSAVTSITAGPGISINQSTGNVTISAGESNWIGTSAGIHTLSNVGIGTTNPQTPLQIETTYGVKTGVGTFAASTGITTTVDTLSIQFLNSEYTLHFQNGSNIQSQKVLVMNNGTTAYIQEYAIMFEPNQIVSVGATVSGSNTLLQVTPETGISGVTTFRFVRHTLR